MYNSSVKTVIGKIMLIGILLIVTAGSASAQDPVYREQNEYPVLDEIRAARKATAAERDSLRAIVDDRYAAEAEAKKEAKLDLRVDWSQVESPTAPDDFKQLWHLPPTPQFYTGTCWAFCSVSFVESEVQRLTGRQIKLSEMWIVYWEYVEKARSHLETFGHTPVYEGGQDHGTFEVIKKYGAMTRDAYPGVLNELGRHDHTPLRNELQGFLKWTLDSGTWDLDQNMAYVHAILNKHMGQPPVSVDHEGRTYTPEAFRDEVLEVNPDDYVACVSRLNEPFGERVLLDVVDNWRRKEDYLNIPLDDFYGVIKDAVDDGYTVCIGGDNSEPGMDGKFDTAIIPEWDIPTKYIDQASREFRIYNRTTTDDHGVHVVGYKKLGGRDWYLIKDSNRSSRLGEFKGYYFWSGNYIKLKMLAVTVHQDRLGKWLD